VKYNLNIKHLQIYIKWFLSIVITLLFYLSIFSTLAWAGPPFLTDDPEPVEYKHIEIYTASQYSNDKDSVSGTAPHFEFNYGIIPNVQLHLIVPFSYSRQNLMPTQYGLGDIELGAKYRFIQETASRPQVGIFPLIEVPTGDPTRNLGSTYTRIFLPVWLQKSWGAWTSYGGGGYWFNPGPGNKNYWFTGWEIQRDLSKKITLGAEVFHSSATNPEGSDETGFNVGTMVNFDDEHHLLFSTGRDFHGPNRSSIYLAYQWTLGPREPKK
jgi:hypothetical protein